MNVVKHVRRAVVAFAVVSLGHAAGPSAAEAERREAWYRVLLSGVPAGAGRDVWVRGDSTRYYENHLRLYATRLGEPIRMVSYVDELDGDNGRLIRFRTEMTVAGTGMKTTGFMRGDSLHLRTEGRGFIDNRTILWQDGAIGQALMDERITAELRQGATDFTLRVFDPHWVDFRTSRFMVREAHADGETPDSALILVDQFDNEAASPSVTLWMDAAYNVKKMVMRQMGVEITVEQISEQTFNQLEIDPNFDMIRASMIPCAGPLVKPHELDVLTFRLHFPTAVGADILTDGPNQAVRALANDAVEVEVTRHTRREEVATTEQLARYLRSDRHIQSDHPTLVAVADSVTSASGAEGFELATELARWVNRHMTRKSYSQGFATALDALSTGEGDCTEHSVLLAALLRAAGIPARIAVGLVYDDGNLAGHMWTEAYVDFWRTLDALDVTTNPVRLRVSASPDERALSASDIMNAYSVVSGMTVEVSSPAADAKGE